MNLYRLFRQIYGVKLPIRGGCGERIDDAIILHHIDILHVDKIEEHVLDLIMTLQDYVGWILKVEMITKNKSSYHRYKVKMQCKFTSRKFNKYYYFDITNLHISNPNLEYYPPKW